MKSLRGTKSLDIIFAGTQNRKSLGFAEASLVFDNSDGALPIEYTEVTVTRKIYRSGETGYYINKVPCRLKDVLELFMDTGIGKDGYSIIGQGKIDEILSNKSEDRRNIFEEAAGIVKYRTRKQESEKKLERTKLNLLRINDILTEIETNIEPLKNQAEKAKRYLDLREELKSIEIGLFIYNIEKYKSTLEEIIKDEEIYTNQCNDEEGRLERIKQLKEELQTSEATETMADYEDHFDDANPWNRVKEYLEKKTVLPVKVEGVVNGGVIVMVEGLRGFVPASRLSLSYIEDLETYLLKDIEVQVIDVDQANNRLVLSARELLKEKEKKAREALIASIQVGSVLKGTVETLQNYGAFVKLENGLSGLVHVSQISQKRVKLPSDVLEVGQEVEVKVIGIKDGKISLSMKALEEKEEEPVEKVEIPKSEDIGTSLGDLFKNLNL